MKKIKLNTAKLRLAKEKIADLTSEEMYKLQGGLENTTMCPTGDYLTNPCWVEPPQPVSINCSNDCYTTTCNNTTNCTLPKGGC